MRNIWVWSDTHFDHVNIIRFSKRKPWIKEGDLVPPEPNEDGNVSDIWNWVSKEIAIERTTQMNEEMIQWHNELIKPGDEVWHLGDICLGRGDVRFRVEELVKSLNGQYNWVFGNHDNRHARKADGFQFKGHYAELRKVGPDKQMFVLSHYAMRTWNKRHHGTIQLYGHSHGSLPEDPMALQCDVGVDCWNYRPVHIDEIMAYMADKKEKIENEDGNWQGEDHHRR